MKNYPKKKYAQSDNKIGTVNIVLIKSTNSIS